MVRRAIKSRRTRLLMQIASTRPLARVSGLDSSLIFVRAYNQPAFDKETLSRRLEYWRNTIEICIYDTGSYSATIDVGTIHVDTTAVAIVAVAGVAVM